MSLVNIPSSERTHIAFFGCRNSGKSSLINAITNQNVSIVSDKKGTTTDAVKKTMELLPLGAVVIIDTAGIDDVGKLGQKRVAKTFEILKKTDIAVLVIDSTIGLQGEDKKLIQMFKDKQIPYKIVYNKSDLVKNISENNELYVSAKNKENINELKESLAKLIKNTHTEKYIIADRLNAKDIVILVTPIDESAPKGRLILPQQLTLRELLDFHCIPVCCQTNELTDILRHIKPKLIITDSQVFNEVKNLIPKDILLTSFSILMANYKGDLKEFVKGAKKIYELQDNDTILISEGCTHHRQCNDIGTVKLPKWIEKYTHTKLNFEFTSGGDFPKDLSKYALIIHCGGCMLNETEMKNRIKQANEQNIPIVNYGIAISYMNGILERSLEILGEI